MDPGTIVAVTDISVKILSILVRYYSEVHNAQAEIQRLSTEVQSLHDVLSKLAVLVQEPGTTRLPASIASALAIGQTLYDIKALEKRLNPSKRGRLMSRVGVRALTWPLTRKDVNECISKIERHKTTFNFALNIDQTSLALDVDANVNQIKKDEDLAWQDRQLAKLPWADGATFDSYFRQHEPQCLPDTRMGLLHQLQEWSKDKDRCIFWVNGMAGTGKSTIARTVAQSFRSQKSLGASFFFSRGTGDLGNAAKFVSTIAHQLAGMSTSVKRHICEAIAANPNIAQSGLRNQWKKLVIQPIAKAKQVSSLTLVIDALDQCEREQDVKLILQLFVEMKDVSTVECGVVVTSRPETVIRLGFRDMPEVVHQDLSLHAIPRWIVEHDISLFLKHELWEIAKLHDLQDWPEEEKIDQLLRASDCLFIYAATVCRFVGDPKWLPKKRLDLILDGESTSGRPTASLDQMYDQILTHSLTEDQSAEDIVELSQRFKRIVGLIVVLFDLLSATALANLLSLSAKEVNLCLDSLHSLLNVPQDAESPIRLLHPSFRDFLLEPKRCQNTLFWIEERAAHEALFTHCLQVMFDGLHRDLCGLESPGTLALEVDRSRVENQLPKHLRYACTYWVDHLERVTDERRTLAGLCDQGQVHEFFLQHLLHWLEALILLGKASNAILMITKLEAMLKNTDYPLLRALVNDAKRFILKNISIIEKAPLQTYVSALVYSPKGSLIRKDHTDQLPSWIRRYPTVATDWSPLLQTLEGHSAEVTALAFSPDGTQLASGSYDKTIRLWDTATGTMQSTLVTIGGTVLAYSPNGKQLASASYSRYSRYTENHTVQLWNPTTGAMSHTLEDHSAMVSALVFSTNGKTLASYSIDKSVRLWDPVNGTLEDMLEIKIPTQSSIEETTGSFSVDGSQLAFQYNKDAVWLQDMKTGVVRILSAPSPYKPPAVFRPDGKQLALATSEDIQLWDTATGVLHSTFKHFHRYRGCCTFVFSPDGDRLADGSWNNTIRLWDPRTGALCNELKGHKEGVWTLAFQPNCKQLASGSVDGIIHLWDLAAELLGSDDQSKEVSHSLLQGDSGRSLSVILSPNHQLLAFSSSGSAVRVFNPRNRQLVSTLQETIDILNMIFSSDSKQLIVTYGDGTIRFWDAITGALCRTLRTRGTRAIALSSDDQRLAVSDRGENEIEILDLATGKPHITFKEQVDQITVAMAFSPSGKNLAMCDYPAKIMLWDLAAGALRTTIEGHSRQVRALAFSNSETWLASSSDDQTVRIWDLATGTILQMFDIGSEVVQLSFSADDSYLDTSRGRMQLFSTSQNVQDKPTSAIWVLEHDWLVRNSQKMLWLPADFRPKCVANSGGLFVFAYASGQIDFIELDTKL